MYNTFRLGYIYVFINKMKLDLHKIKSSEPFHFLIDLKEQKKNNAEVSNQNWWILFLPNGFFTKIFTFLSNSIMVQSFAAKQ